MPGAFRRPTISRDISELMPGQQVNFPSPMDALGLTAGQPTTPFDMPPQMKNRQVSTKGAAPGLAFLADFLTSFGAGPQAGAQQIQARRAGIENFFDTEQQAANQRSGQTLRMVENTQRNQDRDQALQIRMALGNLYEQGRQGRFEEGEANKQKAQAEKLKTTKEIADARLGAFKERTSVIAQRRAISPSGLSPQALSKVTSLSAQFDSRPEVKNFSEQVNRAAGVAAILGSGVGGPGDLATVFEFMKALDPTSVVRESEYAAAAKSGNIFAGWAAKFNGYLKEEGGFLPERVKQDFLKILKSKVAISAQQVKAIHQDFGRRIDGLTGQPGGSKYLTDYPAIFEELMGGSPAPQNAKDPLGILQ